MAVDYTPTLGNYTELKPFRYWCQKVLPLVYDDSLSYYELLCKVVDYLNKTMEDVETLHGDVDNLHTAYEQLQQYVNDYFDNLDVQNEINNKLDTMASDGTLMALIAPTMPDLVGDWLSAHITPTTPAIDNTLSVSGAGADAKKTGAALTGVYSSSATYSWGDIVLYNGALYQCNVESIDSEAWDASKWKAITLAGSINNLNGYVDDITGVEHITEWITGGWLATGASVGTTIDLTDITENIWWEYAVISCNEGDTFTLNGHGGTSPRLWCFVNSDNVSISVSGAELTVNNLFIKAPANSAKLLLNREIAGKPSYKGILPVKTTSDVIDLSNHVKNITKVDTIDSWVNGGYIATNVGVGQAVNTSQVVSANWYQYAIIPCSAGMSFAINGAGGTTPRLWCFVDSDNKVISVAQAEVTKTDLLLIAPATANKLILNRGISNVPCYIGTPPYITNNILNKSCIRTQEESEAFVENLLDPNTTTDGGHYDRYNSWVNESTHYCSDFIPCKMGKTYSLNYLQDVVLYDINKEYVGWVRSESSKSRLCFTVPVSNTPVYYFKVYGLISQKADDCVFNNDLYLGSAKSFALGKQYVVNSKTTGKLIYTFGDSRTSYDLQPYADSTLTPGNICIGYQTWMRRFLTTPVVNLGVSGYTTPQINTYVHNTNISSADVITIGGGINDFLQSITIGTIGAIGGTFDTTTVYGSLQDMIEYILTNKPDAKLMLINPFTGWIQNGSQEFTEAYAVIKKNVAKLYRLPILNLDECCGFNVLNRSTFYCDDPNDVPYYLHLNDKGNAIIGQMISSFVTNGF